MKPSPSQVHVNRPLSILSIAFMQSLEGFVADKVFPVIPSATGISFSIGKIPFHVSFEMPLEVKVSASFAASAAATAGVAFAK